MRKWCHLYCRIVLPKLSPQDQWLICWIILSVITDVEPHCAALCLSLSPLPWMGKTTLFPQVQGQLQVLEKQRLEAQVDIGMSLRSATLSDRLIYTPSQSVECTTLTDLQQRVVQGLLQDDYCVVDGFLDSEAVHSIQQKVAQMNMREARTGGGRTGQGESFTGLRSDLIRWIGADLPEYPELEKYVKHVNGFLRGVLANVPELQQDHVERESVMAACYPGKGTLYSKHVDNPNSNGRVLTTILYLNDGWTPTDGGCLRLHRSSCTIDVEPLFNRWIVFWSDHRNLHEVLPSWAARYTVTIWYSRTREKVRACEEEGTAMPRPG